MGDDILQIYLVGGAVRDQLLGLPVHERDWVVVGATPEEMIHQGYKPVGKDFPVFLHPTTHEEYALARTERKVSRGYKGFDFYCAADVTLEADLKRRDLTINAIAQDKNGTIIDPYGGVEDLKRKQFRHVSHAFEEDPVRILRLARFACRFNSFTIAADTVTLMQNMVSNQEVNALVPERVWKEFERALAYSSPLRFFEVLAQAHALPVLFPEIQIPSAGTQALQQASQANHSKSIRFSCLMHATAPATIKKFCRRFKVPNDFSGPATLLAKHLDDLLTLSLNAPDTILNLLRKLDAIRRPERLHSFIEASQICSDSHLKDKALVLAASLNAISTFDTKPLQQQGLKGKDFANALETHYLKLIQKAVSL